MLWSAAPSAAEFLGVAGGKTNIITGLGGGGAGLFAANSILYSQPRLGVYVAGAKEISCTLGTFASVRAFDSEGFEEDYAELRKQFADVQRLLAKEPGNSVTIAGYAREVVGVATITLNKADEVRAGLNTAGVRMFENVQSIHP